MNEDGQLFYFVKEYCSITVLKSVCNINKNISVVFCFRSLAQIIALTIAVLFILSFIAINFFISKVQVRWIARGNGSVLVELNTEQLLWLK